jgi:DNA modification methylase
MGYDFWGCEINKEYFEASEKRFEKATQQQSLFI